MRSTAFKYMIVCVSIAASHAINAKANQKIEDKELLRCADIKNSLERLTCFDDLVKRLGDPTRVDTKISAGEWSVRTDTSRFDDTKSVYLSLKAKEPISGWPGKTYKPSLYIRCQEKKTQAYVDFGMSPTVESGLYDKSTLQFRIDKKPPFKIFASKSTDGEALFLPNAIGFAKKIMHAREVLVRFVPFNSPPQETSFNVAGLDQAIKPLQEACKWH